MQTETQKAMCPLKVERLIGSLSILLQREKVTDLFHSSSCWRLMEAYGGDRFTIGTNGALQKILAQNGNDKG